MITNESLRIKDGIDTRGGRTFAFCSKALFTKARYMSLRYFSSCFTREFVAIGRGDGRAMGPRDDLDGLDDFLGRLGRLSNDGFGEGSINLTVGVEGPLFGNLLLLY